MIRIILFIIFIIISNKSIAIVRGETLICDKDKRGYSFVDNDKVEVLSISKKKQKIISTFHSYELSENAIFIMQPLGKFNKKKINLLDGYLEEL